LSRASMEADAQAATRTVYKQRAKKARVQQKIFQRKVGRAQRCEATRATMPAYRRARKNSRSNRADSCASKPPCTAMWWLWCGEISVSNTLPAAPVLGSFVPYTTRATRACTSAIAHIAQGSSVTYKVESRMR